MRRLPRLVRKTPTATLLTDSSDNCPNNANEFQIDTDRDGQGDACDADDDNDTVLDGEDNCPLTVNLAQFDSDDDGVGNACQKVADISGVSDMSGDGVPDVAQLRLSGQPKVRYFSGASRAKIKSVAYLGATWAGVASATVVDGNSDGAAKESGRRRSEAQTE